jgi:hypothetical protein
MSKFSISITDDGNMIHVEGRADATMLLCIHDEVVNLLGKCTMHDYTRNFIGLQLLTSIYKNFVDTIDNTIKHDDKFEGDNNE